jgi:hypothetical protein
VHGQSRSQLSREVSRSWPLLGLGGVASGSTNYSRYCTAAHVLVGAWIDIASGRRRQNNTDSTEGHGNNNNGGTGVAS